MVSWTLFLKPLQTGLDKGHVGEANTATWTENWMVGRSGMGRSYNPYQVYGEGQNDSQISSNIDKTIYKPKLLKGM